MEEVNKRDAAEQRLGALITNKWMVGALISVIITLGGYIFQTKDKLSDAQASDIVAIHRSLSEHEVEIADIKATNRAQYNEILRRLERIERVMDSRRSSSPNTERWQ